MQSRKIEVELWKLVLTIAMMLASVVGSYAMMQAKVERLEEKVVNIEKMQKQIYEVQINLKNLCQKEGIPYQQITD